VTDSEAFRASARQLIQNTMQLIDPDPTPLREYSEVISKTMQLIEAQRVAEGGEPFDWSTVLERFPALTAVQTLTAEDLARADEALRTRILPETSEEELEDAVSEVTRDPEKVETAAYLADLVRRATGLPAPWAAFVFVFCVAVAMNPDVVGALALAYAVMQDFRSRG
jgi:hypothetical protein